MKSEKLYEAIGDIDEAYVSEAHKKSRPAWRKWGAIAACLALFVTAASFFLPSVIDEEDITPLHSEEATHFSEAYLYYVDDGAFANYMSGKVIDEAKIGDKIEDVTLTAGWRNNEGDWMTTEHLRGEIYLIDGISKDVAVALKFLDKGDALTTTHYYTLLNPEADLTEVQEYYITPLLPIDGNTPQIVLPLDITEAAEESIEFATEASTSQGVD